MASTANVLRWVDLHGEGDGWVCERERQREKKREGERRREREREDGGRASVCKISTSGIALIQLTAELERDVEFCLSRVEFTR